MHSIELIYILASFAAVIGMVPQIKQLYVTKQSDELSLFTWVLWAVVQFITFLYALSLGALPFILANIVWVGFYVAMCLLIIHYRPKKTGQLAMVKQESDYSVNQ